MFWFGLFIGLGYYILSNVPDVVTAFLNKETETIVSHVELREIGVRLSLTHAHTHTHTLSLSL